MKKIKLAKLTTNEVENLQQLGRNCNTLRTLLKNQFVDDEQRKEIATLLIEAEKKIEDEYNIIVEKYNIPYLAKSTYRISAERNELYIEVYG